MTIQLRHHDICGMGYNRSTDTSNITTEERNSGLLESSVLIFRFAQLSVDCFDSLLECGKFHHGVRDLAAPKWVQAFVKTVVSNISNE
jgi:hypothetical protein